LQFCGAMILRTFGIRIFGITKPGIVSLTTAVAVLWTCFGLAALTRRETSREEADAIQKLAALRHQIQRPEMRMPARPGFPSEPAARPFSA